MLFSTTSYLVESNIGLGDIKQSKISTIGGYINTINHREGIITQIKKKKKL